MHGSVSGLLRMILAQLFGAHTGDNSYNQKDARGTSVATGTSGRAGAAGLSATGGAPNGSRPPRFLARLRGAIRKESWGRTVLKLAWTAGPVTYLALHGGYIIGYGDSPPQQLILYFGIYTVIAGLVAVAMRFLYNAFRGHELEEGTEALHDVLQKLPDLVATARNTNLESYDKDGRLTLAAKYVLENPDATPTEVSQAVHDLTGSSFLASAATASEVYRRHGLTARVHDVYSSAATEIAEALERVGERSEAVAALLRQRLNGLAPTREAGRLRIEGFIERIFASGEQDDDSLTTMSDVEEVFTLCFELLNMRSFPVLKLDYSGGQGFTAASVRLDSARRSLRSTIHARNNRLRALAEYLNSYPEIERVAAAVPSLGSVHEVLRSVTTAMERLYADIFSRARAAKRDRLGLERDLRLWRGALRLFHSLYRENFEVRRKHLALYRAVKEYAAARSKYAGQFALRLLAPNEEGHGIRLRTRAHQLTESQRLALASAVRQLLNSVSVNERFSRALVEGDGESRRYLGAAGYKHLARELLALISNYIPLHQSRVQYTIEGTNAPNLSAIHSEYSSDVKRRWGEALVREIRTTSTRAAERLATALVVYHGVTLTDESMRYLKEHWGVDRGSLQSAAEQAQESGHVIPRQGIEKQLLHIPPPPRKYQSLAEILQRRTGFARIGEISEQTQSLLRSGMPHKKRG